jgi:hypothetical protein
VIRPKNSKGQLRDPDIRFKLLREIETRFCDKKHDLILQEFGCNAARIDVAVVNGALHGFEIKSDCDSLERLDLQIAEYGKIFDYVTLVTGNRLFDSARRRVPSWWGIGLAIFTDEAVHIRERRKPKKNPCPDPLSLAQMLWKRETIQCLRRSGMTGFSPNQPADELWAELAQHLPVEVLASEVRAAIKKRGGSGFEWLRTQNGGSSTIVSTAGRLQYRQNLDWLLSLK